MRIVRSKNLLIFFYLLPIFITIAIFYKTFYNFSFFQVDDELLIGPIIKCNDLSKILFSCDTLDFQPVRDISYWVDFKLSSFININIYRLSNFVFWIIGCILYLRFIKAYSERFNFRIALSIQIFIYAIYAIHTAHAFPVFWLSSRKHLLALIFILLASHKVVKDELHSLRDQWILLLLLLFSMLSHPIYGVWFFWLFFSIYQKYRFNYFKKNKLFISSVLIISSGLLFKNILFYSQKKTDTPSYTGIDVPYNWDNIVEILNIYGQYTLNLFKLNGNALFYESENVFNLLGMFILIALFIVLFSKKNEKINYNVLVLTLSVSALYTFKPLGTYVQNTYALFFNGCVLLLVAIVLNRFSKRSIQRKIITQLILSAYYLSCIFYTNDYINKLQNNLAYIEHNKNLYRVPVISGDFVRLKVREAVIACDYQGKNVFEKIIPEMLYLKYTLQRDKILMSKTGMGSVYDAYYHTLFYLNRHEKMNLEVKKEIIERICLDHIIYCNYYYGEILSQLKNVESAEKKLEQAFIQLFDIIKNAPRDLFNGGYAARWCEIGTGLVSYKTKNEKIIKMQTMLIDYLLQFNLTETLICIKNQGKANVKIEWKPYQDLQQIIRRETF